MSHVALQALLGVCRRYHYEYKLARLLWKVDMEDIITLRTNSEYSLQNAKSTVNVSYYHFTLSLFPPFSLF